MALAVPAAQAAPAPVAPAPALLAEAAAKIEPGQDASAFRGLEDAVRQSLRDPALKRPVQSALVRLLDPGASTVARRFACEQLAVVGGDEALAPLGKMLLADDTAGLACLALGRYPEGRADTVLRQGLALAKGNARLQIITTLGDRRDGGAVGPLAELAHGQDPAAAEASVAALGKIGDRPAAKVLESLTAVGPPTLRVALAEARLRIALRWVAEGRAERAAPLLQNLATNSASIGIQRGALAALLPLDPDGGELRILSVLRGTNSALHPVAIARVPGLTDLSASSVFATELHHLPPAEQALMVEALGVRADLDARLMVCTCLSSTYEVVRRAAINTVARIGDDWYVHMLARALSLAKTSAEKKDLEHALATLPGGEATDQAITMEIPRASGHAGAELMSALIQRIGTAATPALLAETHQNDPTKARFAWRALGRTATPTETEVLVETLASLKDPEVRPEAQLAVEKALGRLPAGGSRSVLLRAALAKADSAEGRGAILGLLPTAGDAEALAAVKAALGAREASVREAAVGALADWPNLDAWESLAKCYRKPAKESIRWIALRGLTRMVDEENEHPGPHFADHYRELVAGARNAVDLKVILSSLPRAANLEVLQIALAMLDNPEVRRETDLAVRGIAESLKASHPAEAAQALVRLSNAEPKTTAPAAKVP